MKISSLEKKDLRELWKNEATDFTVWLENNIEQLSNKLGFDLEVIDREKKIGSFSIDLYCHTGDGQKVIIENQLEKTDHSIFMESRASEFDTLYRPDKDTKTILAWGVNPKGKHLKEMALKKKLVNIHGMQQEGVNYYYPNPIANPKFKEEWIKVLIEQIS